MTFDRIYLIFLKFVSSLLTILESGWTNLLIPTLIGITVGLTTFFTRKIVTIVVMTVLGVIVLFLVLITKHLHPNEELPGKGLYRIVLSGWVSFILANLITWLLFS